MGVEATKLELLDWISNLEDETTIGYLKIVKDTKLDDDICWALSTEQEIQINQGLQAIATGKATCYEQVKAYFGF